jgi:hypothetical protein
MELVVGSPLVLPGEFFKRRSHLQRVFAVHEKLSTSTHI